MAGASFIIQAASARRSSGSAAASWIALTASQARLLGILALLVMTSADTSRRQLLDLVNMRTQSEVAFAGGVKWSLGDRGDCTTFTLHNFQALRSRGISATAWIVWDDRGQGHAVVVSGDQVLDSHYRHIKSRKALERMGYRFRFPLSDSLVADLVRLSNPATRRG